MGKPYKSSRGITSSREHSEVMKEYGLDRYTASAYLIALRGIEKHTLIQKAILKILPSIRRIPNEVITLLPKNNNKNCSLWEIYALSIKESLLTIVSILHRPV